MSVAKLSDDIFSSPEVIVLDHSIRIINVGKCTSTQDLLLNWWQNTKTSLNYVPVVLSPQQEAGRGQKNKIWYSDEGSLTFSLIFNPSIQPSWTSLEISVLLRNFFYEEYNVETYLKWPNDLLTSDQKKIAGILCHGLKEKVVVGIGINLWPTINHELDKTLNRGYVFEHSSYDKIELLKKLMSYLTTNRFSNIETLKKNWLSFCLHQNKKITYQNDDQIIQGVFNDLGPFGEAIITSDVGQKLHITNGLLTIN